MPIEDPIDDSIDDSIDSMMLIVLLHDHDLQHPFAMGITLQHLYAETTDDLWNPAFIKNDSPLIYKVRASIGRRMTSECLLTRP